MGLLQKENGGLAMRDMEPVEVLNDFFTSVLMTRSLVMPPKFQKAKVGTGRRKIHPL